MEEAVPKSKIDVEKAESKAYGLKRSFEDGLVHRPLIAAWNTYVGHDIARDAKMVNRKAVARLIFAVCVSALGPFIAIMMLVGDPWFIAASAISLCIVLSVLHVYSRPCEAHGMQGAYERVLAFSALFKRLLQSLDLVEHEVSHIEYRDLEKRAMTRFKLLGQELATVRESLSDAARKKLTDRFNDTVRAYRSFGLAPASAS